MGMSGVNIPYEGTANFGRNSVLMMALFTDNICQAPTLETVTVPLLLTSLQQQALSRNPNAPTAKKPVRVYD